VIRIGLSEFVRLLLEGDVGLDTGVLVREPAMQLNHVVSSSGFREETTTSITKSLLTQGFSTN
jgi:hypothetical protein